MGVQATPYVETSLSHSAELFRRELQAGLPFGSAGGVVPATPATSANLTAGVAGCSDLRVNAPASGMSVLLNAGQIVVPGSLGSTTNYGMGICYGYPVWTLNGGSAPTIASNAKATAINLTTQGSYYCYSDYSSGQVSNAISASNPTNPRIDVVGAQVEDSAYSGSTNDWKLTVITGTAASSPAVPTFPANFVPLALVWVPANASSIVAADILDLRVAYNRNPFRWHAAGNTGQTLSGAQVTIICNTTAQDLVGNYSISTGLWTAPVSGLYYVSAAIAVSWSTTFANTQASALVAGSTNAPGVITPATNGSVGSYLINGPVRVDQGQTLGIASLNPSGTVITDGRFTFFAGYLVCPT